MRVRLALLASVVVALAVPVGASAHPVNVNTMAQTLGNATMALTHPPADDRDADFATTRNMRLMGFSERRITPNDFSQLNSDLAFWRHTAYQGTWSGFRIIDIKDPRNPEQLIDYRDCAHPSGQGDMVVWGSILVRTWDANNVNPTTGPARTCDGEPVPSGPAGGPPGTGGFEGLHIFDVSDPGNPDLVASVDLTCGSHTATGVPDLRNRRLLVYSTPSSGACEGIDVVEVPLSRPQESEFLHFEPADRGLAADQPLACHDTAVILGRANKAACAGGVGYALWSLGGKDGGSLDNPRFLYNRVVPEIASALPNVDNATGHSAAFTWDGETVIFGHEPGGGTQPRCQAVGAPVASTSTGRSGNQTADMKSFFFYETDSGAAKGKWALTRNQTAQENCTIHNYNLIPTKTDDILVHGSYQSGIGVLDMSNTSSAREVAYADPAPLPDPPGPATTQIGGDWSSHFYDGLIYESDITRGLWVWRFQDRDAQAAFRLRHLNPQTQEFTIGAKKDHDRWDKRDKRHDNRWKGGGH
jgi:hypothetical protein